MKKYRKVILVAGRPSGGQQQPAASAPVPAPALTPVNPPTGGPAATGGQSPSQQTVTSSTTTTSTRQKMPKWKNLGIAAIVVIFAIMIVMIVGMSKAREAEREAFLAALDEAKAVQELPTEVEPEGEEILNPDVSFVREGVESVPESAQETVMSDGSVILGPSVTEETPEVHGGMPTAIATSARKVSGGVEIGYTFQNLPEYGDFQIVVGLWNSWPGQEYPVVEKTIVASRYPGTAFVEITEQEWSKVDSILISARDTERRWEASGGFHQLSEFK